MARRRWWRDLRGHFARREDAGELCPHKCCQGKRVHPWDAELVPSRAVLAAMTDAQMAGAMAKMDWSNERRVKAFMREADRRDAADRRRARDRDRSKVRRDRQAEDHRLAVHAAYLAAERETRGHMLSKAGERARVDPATLLTGTRARARKYGSEEFNEWLDKHGQVSITRWRADMARQRDELEELDRRRASSAPYPELAPW